MRNPFKTFFSSIAHDIREFDRGNTDEQKVLDAVFFSAYRGMNVIKNRLPGTTSFCIFKTLFINGTKKKKYMTNADSVRHEYGHSLQEEYMGFFRYLKRVAIPSVKGYRKGLPTEEYYAQKWEHDADILGNVKRWE